MTVTWNPEQYSRFADDRGRPFFDLLDRVEAENPALVVDLGCGPGNLTLSLGQRWRSAEIVGIDSSPEMIAKASAAADGHAAAAVDHAETGPSGHAETRARISFQLTEIQEWQPGPDVQVLVSNAALQWVPTHRELLRQWAGALSSGAWMAWQVPGNFQAPSHALLRELAESPVWTDRLVDVLRFTDPVDTAAEYAGLLLELGWTADTWETRYTHVLQGRDAVLEWVRGTTLGPVRAALSAADFEDFERAYGQILRAAYPARSWGTLYPFRRIFAVGHKH